jgi:hypothetical protein
MKEHEKVQRLWFPIALPVDWLQERLGLSGEQSIGLAQRFPEVRALSVNNQLQPALDWFKQRIGLKDEKLGELRCDFSQQL